MQRKKLNIWLPTLFALSMVVGLLLGYKMRDVFPDKTFFQTEKKKTVQEVIDLVKERYVDVVDLDAISDSAIVTILAQLDPHSQYIPPALLEAANDDIAGSFYGIGIEFDLLDDTLNVINVLHDGPAFKAGLKSGDKILSAGDSILSGTKRKSADIRNVLKGNRGSAVMLKVLRKNETLNISVNRDVVSVNSVSAAYMLDDSTGFIHLEKFSQNTYREFMIELEKLVNSGMKNLIFDLRGNGGGIMDAAVEIADEFLDGDKLITYTEGRKTPKVEYRSRRPGMFEKGKVVFLADEGSASASEILMGALQDWDRATVVGRRTFGKGLVQEQFALNNKGALRLTVSRYYTPLGRSIQRKYDNGIEDYYNDIKNIGSVKDSAIHDSTDKMYRTPKGKILYEGGGISPDVWIESDTASISYTMAYIYGNRLIQTFAYRFTNEHQEALKSYATPATFEKDFQVNDLVLEYFTKEILKDSANISALNNSEMQFLKRSMKLYIARQLWQYDGYYKVLNADDQALLRALEMLKN